MANKKSTPVDICKESQYISPFTIFNILELCKIHDFFQYKTANAKDSPLSFKLDEILTDNQKDQLWKEMLDCINVSDDHFLFDSILRNKISDIRALKLSDTTLVCDRIKGFIHQNNPPKDRNLRAQHKIDALFKRFRDAFAHGRIATDGEYVILEDKTNELTGRVVMTVDALSKWEDVIETFIEKNADEITTNII